MIRLSSLSRRPALLAAGLLFASGAPRVHATAPGAPPPEPVMPSARPHKPASDEIHGLLNLGHGMTDRREYESAEIAFRQVLDPNAGAGPEELKDALLGMARMHRRQGASVKAVAIYEKFLATYPGDPRTPDVLLESGRTMRAMGSHRLALTRFYSVINSTLKLPDKGFEHYQQLAKTAQFEIAETHFQSGNYAEAAKFYGRLRLLDLAPADRARAHFKAAYALTLQGDHEAAVNMLHTYLGQWTDDENVPEARYLLATSLHALGRTQDALSATLDLLRTQQTHPGVDAKRWAYWQRRTGNQLANNFFERGDILSAQLIYTRLAALTDDPAWRLPVLYQIALCHERLGATDRARLAYQDIIEAGKRNPTAEITELSRMAAWRLGHLDWDDSTRHDVSAIFESTTGQTGPRTPAKTSTPSP